MHEHIPANVTYTNPEQGFRDDVPMQRCSICSRERKRDDMINFWIMIGSPGHYSMPPLQHGPEEWACSPRCWEAIVHRAAIRTREQLESIHNQIEGSVHSGDNTHAL